MKMTLKTIEKGVRMARRNLAKQYTRELQSKVYLDIYSVEEYYVEGDRNYAIKICWGLDTSQGHSDICVMVLPTIGMSARDLGYYIVGYIARVEDEE